MTEFKDAWNEAQQLYELVCTKVAVMSQETQMLVATQLFCAYRITQAIESVGVDVQAVEFAVRRS